MKAIAPPVNVVSLALVLVLGLSAAGLDTANPDPVRDPLEAARPVESTAPSPPPLVVDGVTGDVRERLTDALDRFDDADLTLPPLDIAFHDHRSGCEGHPGLFRLVDGVADIEVCDWTTHTILHELGHAWVASHVDDEIRSTLVAYWGLETWNDQSVAWGLRANERAAESIALALTPLPPRIAPSLQDHLCAYSLLTGQSVDADVDGNC